MTCSGAPFADGYGVAVVLYLHIAICQVANMYICRLGELLL